MPVIICEEHTFNPDSIARLKTMGYEVIEKRPGQALEVLPSPAPYAHPPALEPRPDGILSPANQERDPLIEKIATEAPDLARKIRHMNENLVLGRVVHYVIRHSADGPDCYAGMIVRVANLPTELAEVRIFPPLENRSGPYTHITVRDLTGQAMTWHYAIECSEVRRRTLDGAEVTKRAGVSDDRRGAIYDRLY